MTALQIIESLLPLIEGSKVSKEPGHETLLTYLNFAKAKLARDTGIWLGGETIILTGENIYTLSTIPLQIVEVYDDSLQIRPKNKFSHLGYTQLAPNKIFVNTPSIGQKLHLNWKEEPADYAFTDEVYIPKDLIEAMQHYVAYKVFNVYKSESEEIKTKIHLSQYNDLVSAYIAQTDTPEIDSIYEIDQIALRGLV